MKHEPTVTPGDERRRRAMSPTFPVTVGTERSAIELSFPANPASVDILRSVVGRACRIAGFSYDGIEDFAMAVDEAAMILIESNPSDLYLSVRGMDGSSELEALVSARQPTKSLHLGELRKGYRWDVLQALCEGVRWEDAGVAIGLTQSVR